MAHIGDILEMLEVLKFSEVERGDDASSTKRRSCIPSSFERQEDSAAPHTLQKRGSIYNVINSPVCFRGEVSSTVGGTSAHFPSAPKCICAKRERSSQIAFHMFFLSVYDTSPREIPGPTMTLQSCPRNRRVSGASRLFLQMSGFVSKPCRHTSFSSHVWVSEEVGALDTSNTLPTHQRNRSFPTMRAICATSTPRVRGRGCFWKPIYLRSSYRQTVLW